MAITGKIQLHSGFPVLKGILATAHGRFGIGISTHGVKGSSGRNIEVVHVDHERRVSVLQMKFYREIVHGNGLIDTGEIGTVIVAGLILFHGKHHVVSRQGGTVGELNTILQLEGIQQAVFAFRIGLSQIVGDCCCLCIVVAKRIKEDCAGNERRGKRGVPRSKGIRITVHRHVQIRAGACFLILAAASGNKNCKGHNGSHQKSKITFHTCMQRLRCAPFFILRYVRVNKGRHLLRCLRGVLDHLWADAG